MRIAALAQLAPREPLRRIDLDDFDRDRHPLAAGEVEVSVHHCSVCHSDVHLVDGDWGEVARPLVVGHEIVGAVVAVGAGVPIGLGTVVGIGWQAGACGACRMCRSEREQLCEGGKVRTCVGRPGGFAERVRVDARFCFELPSALDPAGAAPLLCAGLTAFSPLERLGVGPRTRVGIVGLGGLGHLAVAFARALGAPTVVAFDPDVEAKRELARRLGADELVDARAALPSGAFDLILVTTHADLAWDAWLATLDLEGTLCLVGVPRGRIEVAPDAFLDGQKKLTGSVVGSPDATRRMLTLAAERAIAPIVEHAPMSAANAALDRVRRGDARFRVVLDQDLGRLDTARTL